MPDAPESPFSSARLVETLSAYPGAGDDADQPAAVRFLRGVARLVKKRAGIVAPTGDGSPSVFLLLPAVPPALAGVAALHPMLDNGLTDVEGKLWFVGPVVLRGHSAPLPTSDADIWRAVEDLGLGSVTAVLYDPRLSPPEVRYYANGLENADDCQVTPVLATGTVTLDDIFAVIDRVHDRQLVTPDAQSEMGKLWADQRRAHPVSKAEMTVQMYLETALNVGFPTCTVRREQSQTTGRLDLELEEADPWRPESFVRHAVLELKVLRSVNSKGSATSANETAKWVADGVDQVHAYRTERGALASALCCFDMRASHDDPFSGVKEKAAQLHVVLRSWPMFPTARKRRRDLAASALTHDRVETS